MSTTPADPTAPESVRAAFGDWTPQAVVFDCDGLLLDTERVWMRAQDAVVARIGAVLTPEDDELLHGSTIEAAAEVLAAGGLLEHFTVLEASDTVDRPKPAPDMYAAAARALGVAPEDTLALEDSGTGAQAARDAGLRLIAVPTHLGSVPEADLVLGSLEDPALAAWIATW